MVAAGWLARGCPVSVPMWRGANPPAEREWTQEPRRAEPQRSGQLQILGPYRAPTISGERCSVKCETLVRTLGGTFANPLQPSGAGPGPRSDDATAREGSSHVSVQARAHEVSQTREDAFAIKYLRDCFRPVKFMVIESAGSFLVEQTARPTTRS